MMTQLIDQKIGNRSTNQLVLEYDSVIQQLNQQIETYKLESESLKGKVKTVTDENNRLHSELQSALEPQIRQNPGNDGQIDFVLKERESYMDLWRQATEELENFKHVNVEQLAELESCKSDLTVSKKALEMANVSVENLQSKCDQLERERLRCLETAQKLDREVQSLQEHLSQSNIKLKAANIKNEDLKVSLEEAKRELTRKSSYLQSINNRDSSIDHRLHSLRTTNTELEARLTAVQKEYLILRDKKPDMEAQISLLQEKVQVLEKREQAAVDHVRESVEMIETALAEKQQSEFREQQCVQENVKLKKTISVLLDEAGAKTKAELDRLKSEYNRNIDKMAEEIRQMEKDSSEKQAKLERTQREKKEVEKELKKIVAQGPQEQTWVKNTLSDLRNKLFTAERARDELSTRVTSMELTKATQEARLSEERRQNAELLEQLQSERKRNFAEASDLRQEIASLTEQCKAQQEKVFSLEASLKDTEKKQKKQVMLLKEQCQLKEKELVSRAKSAQESHTKITVELRELVTAQQTMAIKWREETGLITSKFERSVAELNRKLAEEKKRSREMADKYTRHKSNNEKLTQRVNTLEEELYQASQELREAESKARHASNQLNVLLLREKKMMKEKRDAQRQLDQAKLQIARNLSIMDGKVPTTNGIQFSKSYLGPTGFDASSVFPSRQYVFDSFNKGLHSTPRVPATRTGSTRTKNTDLPLNLTKEDLDETHSSVSTLQSQ